MDASLIMMGLQGLALGAQNYRNLKDIVRDALNFIDKKKPAENWCLYLNPMERFKISWPSQRWSMRELGGLLPTPAYVYVPIQLRFKLNPPKNIANTFETSLELLHNITVTVDMHGSIDMDTYVRTALKQLSVALNMISAEFHEERSAHRVDKDGAIVAGRLEFKPSTKKDYQDNDRNNIDLQTSSGGLWKLLRIVRSGDRMYTITGTLVESAGMEELAYNDIISIMNTFSSS